MVPRAEPQPEVDPDTAVQPDDDQQQALPPGAVRPQQIQQIDVVVVEAEAQMRPARAEDVHD
jgi:hypothetical protein